MLRTALALDPTDSQAHMMLEVYYQNTQVIWSGAVPNMKKQ